MSKSFTFEEGMETFRNILELKEEDFKYREADDYEKRIIDKEWNKIKKDGNIKLILICIFAIVLSVILFYENITLMICVIMIWILFIILSIISNGKNNFEMSNGNYLILTGICKRKDYSNHKVAGEGRKRCYFLTLETDDKVTLPMLNCSKSLYKSVEINDEIIMVKQQYKYILMKKEIFIQ